MPSQTDIQLTLTKAKEDAKNAAIKLGIINPIIDVVHIKDVNSVISETDGDILEETEQLSDDECDNHLSNIPDSVPDLTSSLSEDEDSPDFSDDLS